MVAEILSESLRDDPVVTWLIPNDEHRHRGVADYFLAVAQHLYLPHHEVYLTESAAGAALWLPPGVSAGSVRSLAILPVLWRLSWIAGLTGLRRAIMIATAVIIPKEPRAG